MRTALEVAFWVAAGLLAWTQVAYGLALAALVRVRRPPPQRPPDGPGVPDGGGRPSVSVVVAAYREAGVIADKVANLRALDWPADHLEVIVACDGSDDGTAERARAAGADLVLELPRGGKGRAQDAAVARARGDVLAFSDANAFWAADALGELVAPLADPRVGYVCGQVAFERDAGGTNQEGLYWRHEMRLRERESRLASITAGNGAIYALRRDAWVEVDPDLGHDLALPFNVVKRGRRALYAPRAHATERMVPTLEGEFARKRRMMRHTWPIVLHAGMLSPRGYGPLYAVMILSHRVLRYASPLLHVVALATSAALAPSSALYAALLGVQVAVLLAAALAGRVRVRPLLVCRYYVLVTASLAAGLWDWLRHGATTGWEPAEGTR